MTLNTTTSKTIVYGNGVTTTFSFAFNIPAPGDELVIYTNAAGVSTTLTAGTGASNYTISGFSNPAGGTLTYPNSGTPIASGTQITIARVMPLTQNTSFSNQGSNYPASFEQVADFLTMMVQQLSEQQTRLVQAPITDPAGILYLPSSAARANKALTFDASGNITASVAMPTGTLSAAMAPVVGATSVAAARTAMGLGAISVENIGGGVEDDGSGNLRVKFPLAVVSTNQAPAAANHLTQYACTGALTITLPQASTCFAGYALWIYAPALTGSITVTPFASDVIAGNASGTSITLSPGSGAFITTDAAALPGTWYMINSSGAGTNATVAAPGGYLTLISPSTGVLIQPADVTNATTIYYSPDAGGLVPVYNGTSWGNYAFTGLSCALNAAQQTSNTVHDCFIAITGGAPVLVIGPAWRNSGNTAQMTAATAVLPIVITAVGHNLSNNDVVVVSGVQGNTAANGIWPVTGVSGNNFSLSGSAGAGTYTAGTGRFAARGVGSGTTQLVRQNGIWTNAVSMTAYNGVTAYTVGANQGTYVGSILIDGTSGQISNYRSYGQSRKWGVWNCYNRKTIVLKAGDSTASWAISGGGSTVVENGNAANSLTAFCGLPEEITDCRFSIYSNDQNRAVVGWGSTSVHYGLDGVTVLTGGTGGGGSWSSQGKAEYTSAPFLGPVTIYCLEQSMSGGALSGTETNNLLTCRYRG